MKKHWWTHLLDWRFFVSLAFCAMVAYGVFTGVTGQVERSNLVHSLRERVKKVNELRDKIDVLNRELRKLSVASTARQDVLIFEIAVLENELKQAGVQTSVPSSPGTTAGTTTGSGGSTTTTTTKPGLICTVTGVCV